jgi:hypothetical protein
LLSSINEHPKVAFRFPGGQRPSRTAQARQRSTIEAISVFSVKTYPNQTARTELAIRQPMEKTGRFDAHECGISGAR